MVYPTDRGYWCETNRDRYGSAPCAGHAVLNVLSETPPFSSFFGYTTSPAQSPELIDANNRSLELRAEGRYEEALPFAKRAVGLGEQEFGASNPRFATLLNNLANLYLLQGRYADAEPLYKRALAIREGSLAPDHPDLATSLNDLAGLYSARPWRPYLVRPSLTFAGWSRQL